MRQASVKRVVVGVTSHAAASLVVFTFLLLLLTALPGF